LVQTPPLTQGAVALQGPQICPASAFTGVGHPPSAAPPGTQVFLLQTSPLGQGG
jgi:hypothetical protein